MLKYLIIVIYTFGFNLFLSRFNYLNDQKKLSKHKNLISKSITPPFSGGLIFLITLILFLPNNLLIFKLSLFLIFIIGFLSDTNFIKSPNIRFSIQTFILITFIIIMDVYIQNIRIDKFALLFENNLFKLFFTTFCLLILINGTNFIDGVNTLVIGYYLIILFFVVNLSNDLSVTGIQLEIMHILIFSLICLFILNFFELLYLGDGGAYLISYFVGVILIKLTFNNELISPYYTVNLLWYPAYEILFSILRKIKNNKSAFKPDNQHFHQILYLKLEKNFKNKSLSNSLTGILICFYHFTFIYFATMYYSNTKYQVALTLISLIIYNFLYFILKKNKIKKN